MIKAFAITILLTVAGTSISEFTLSPSESFTLHAGHDYQFSLMECGTDCISLQVSQLLEGKPAWTGKLFDLKAGKSYPMNMEFEDITFDSVYVVSAGNDVTLRVQYRESAPVLTSERLVKATAEKETTGRVSWVIIGEVSIVIALVFFVIYRYMSRRTPHMEESTEDVPSRFPRPVMGFHDSWQPGIPRRHEEDDPDLELLEHLRELDRLKEEEMQQRMWRRMDEEDKLGLDWV
jgi:hypothetical protein